ncbi:glycosyltransferase [Mangrovimonas sp. ST2L15]|uniref:glycosyltransferase n=1 Tax=Mangrovimonas sp. ST2L15 TaxID=1645916 RepID=UPI0006B5B410|nr:glycosyltransferase [Mangrovimonas sp. ST2L15]
MRNKNILIVSPTKVGLTETFIKAHLENLHGKVFYLYGYDLNYKTKEDIPLNELLRCKKTFKDKFLNLLPHYFWFKIHKNIQKALSNENLIKRYILENHIDVVLAEYGTAGSFITPICKSLNIPLIVHFHGFDASKYKTLETFREGYRLMFDYAHKIIVVSEAMKLALKNEGCPQEKLVLNTYGPNPEYLKVAPNYSSNTIVAVGRQTYKKAPYISILAFKKVLESHPNLNLVMIGDGELYEVSKHLVESLGLENKVNLPGGLERQKIIGYLKDSFLFIQHSLVARDGDSEGTPVGIIEAMVAGLPIVSTLHAGIPDVVLDGETGFLVKEGEIEEMAKKMELVINDRELAERMGRKGKERIKSNFTLEKHIQVIDEIIAAIK